MQESCLTAAGDRNWPHRVAFIACPQACAHTRRTDTLSGACLSLPSFPFHPSCYALFPAACRASSTLSIRLTVSSSTASRRYMKNQGTQKDDYRQLYLNLGSE
ncbi:MAG: hypothetical protein LKE40_15660 [Spirochaetia bacterium]|nr:hypothetical protein [Spirochaetia bacterium]